MTVPNTEEINRNYNRRIIPIISLASLLFGIFTAIIVLAEWFTGDAKSMLVDRSSGWFNATWIFFGFGFLAVFGLQVLGTCFQNRPLKPLYLVFNTICVLFVFCLTNTSGGLTGSPFISLYPTVITLTLIVYGDIKYLRFVLMLIAITSLLTLFFQYERWVPIMVRDESFYYLAKFWFVVFSPMALIAITDYSTEHVEAIRKILRY